MRHAQRVVVAHAHAKTGQLALGKAFAGAVHVVGQQNMVARLQQSQANDRDGCQPRGHQYAVGAAL